MGQERYKQHALMYQHNDVRHRLSQGMNLERTAANCFSNFKVRGIMADYCVHGSSVDT